MPKGTGKLSGYLTYMACDNERCLPPTDVDFSYDLASANEKQEEPSPEKKKSELQEQASLDSPIESSDLSTTPQDSESSTAKKSTGDEEQTSEIIVEKITLPSTSIEKTTSSDKSTDQDVQVESLSLIHI